jgi:hypothetical protein
VPFFDARRHDGSMNADRRAMALAVLDLIGGSDSDEALAERFGDHKAVADGAAYLAGFVVEALARERSEPASATVALLRRSLRPGGRR